MERVLHVNRSMHRGGIETFIMNIYRTIDRSEIQFDFLLNQLDDDYREEIEQLGGHIYIIPPRSKGLMKYYQNLDSFFKENASRYNTIHLHASSLSLVSPLFYAKKYGIKNRIIHSHSSHQAGLLHLLLHNFNKFCIHRLATCFFACSDRSKEWMYKYTGVMGSAKIINNGIIANDFKYNTITRVGIRNSLGINTNECVLGLVANLIPVKNHKFLIDVFREFQLMVPDSKLLIIGSGKLENQIKGQIEEFGLSTKVLCLGKRGDIPALLQGFDAFVMPSLWEGLPLSLVEAQTSGLPVFCSDTISPMSKVTGNYYPLSLSLGAKEWAEFIREKMNEFIRKDELNQIVSSGFDIRDTTKQLAKIYIS